MASKPTKKDLLDETIHLNGVIDQLVEENALLKETLYFIAMEVSGSDEEELAMVYGE